MISPELIAEMEAFFHEYDGGIGEHYDVTTRSWCFLCSEWCYDDPTMKCLCHAIHNIAEKLQKVKK